MQTPDRTTGKHGGPKKVRNGITRINRRSGTKNQAGQLARRKKWNNG